MAEKDLHNAMPPMLSADNLAGGALVELLGEALKRVGEKSSVDGVGDIPVIH